MHGIFVPQLKSGEIIVEGEENHHLKVKRIREGEKVFLTDGKGGFCIGEVRKLGKKYSTVFCPQIEQAKREKQLSVFLSIIEQSRLEWAVEKLTEISTCCVYIFPAKRSQPHRIRLERLVNKAVQAVKQSMNPFLPQIVALSDLYSALDEAGKFQGRFYLQKGGEKTRNFPASSAFFVGPEGGWAEEEIFLFEKNGIRAVELGNTILRAETASIAIASLFMLI